MPKYFLSSLAAFSFASIRASIFFFICSSVRFLPRTTSGRHFAISCRYSLYNGANSSAAAPSSLSHFCIFATRKSILCSAVIFCPLSPFFSCAVAKDATATINAINKILIFIICCFCCSDYLTHYKGKGLKGRR